MAVTSTVKPGGSVGLANGSASNPRSCRKSRLRLAWPPRFAAGPTSGAVAVFEAGDVGQASEDVREEQRLLPGRGGVAHRRVPRSRSPGRSADEVAPGD